MEFFETLKSKCPCLKREPKTTKEARAKRREKRRTAVDAVIRHERRKARRRFRKNYVWPVVRTLGSTSPLPSAIFCPVSLSNIIKLLIGHSSNSVLINSYSYSLIAVWACSHSITLSTIPFLPGCSITFMSIYVLPVKMV